jgi:NAD(P)H-flavin reductase
MTGELVRNTAVNASIFSLEFLWRGSVPRAGQFFMVRPKRSSVFLGRPLSVAAWKEAAGDKGFTRTVQFLVARRGKGTAELAEMNIGESAELTGPLGNAWTDFLFSANMGREGEGGEKPVALVGGGIGVAPLRALFVDDMRSAAGLPNYGFAFYAGFRTGFRDMEEKQALLGPVLHEARNLVIATEDGGGGQKGLIPGFLEPEKYAAVCACGPEPMLKAVAKRCAAARVPCFVSLERRMACGVGACLGCTVRTVNGNRRCCADGPVFNAEELVFD